MSKPIDPYNKIMIDTFPKTKTNTTMSKNTKKLFTSFLKVLDDGLSSWKRNSKEIVSLGVEHMSRSDFANGATYKYIPEEIRDNLDKHSVYQVVYSFHIEKRVYRVALVQPVNGRKEKPKPAFFNDALKKIYLWLYLISPGIADGCSETMNIHIFFTDHKKQIASIKRTPLGELHVNTAFTTSCKQSTYVHIYRKEEWFKVFIHETFHNLGLDFSSMDDSVSNTIILKHFQIDAPNGIRLYESYCEMWAEIIHIVFIAFFTTRGKKTTDILLNKIHKMLHEEIMFSTYQCVKILKHYDLSYAQLTDTKSKIAKTNYHENSYILSYYIIKAALLSQYDQFINWCGEHNCKNSDRKRNCDSSYTIKTVAFTNTSDNIEQYARFAVDASKNEQFLHRINAFEELTPKIPTGHEILTTLRMTVHEID